MLALNHVFVSEGGYLNHVFVNVDHVFVREMYRDSFI